MIALSAECQCCVCFHGQSNVYVDNGKTDVQISNHDKMQRIVSPPKTKLPLSIHSLRSRAPNLHPILGAKSRITGVLTCHFYVAPSIGTSSGASIYLRCTSSLVMRRTDDYRARDEAMRYDLALEPAHRRICVARGASVRFRAFFQKMYVISGAEHPFC